MRRKSCRRSRRGVPGRPALTDYWAKRRGKNKPLLEMKLQGEWAGDSTPAEPGLGVTGSGAGG
ncbi:MAG: hypothetical protein WCG47_29140, partial [Dermatophilaceae bacterium]